MAGTFDRKYAAALDDRDPLAESRRHFELPPSRLYFDGNSLGPPPTSARRRLQQVAEREWAQDLIASWNQNGWIDLPNSAGQRIAPLIGADENEVVVCDSVSVNLFKLLSAALDLRPGRPVILCQEDHFPTDRYIAQGLVDRLGEPHRLEPFAVDRLDEALAHCRGQAAAVCLSHVDFRSGRLEDMRAITAQIHRAGALAVWDLSHSAGALPVALGDCGVDFAVGCGYKFLNGGPGAPSFLYVARRHHRDARSPLQGWLGHRDPFAFSSDYEPADGVLRFVCGTPPILALAALDGALEVFEEVDMQAVRDKSMQLGELFLELVRQRIPSLEIACPHEASKRGSQVTLRHPEGWAIMQALIARGVVGDFRAPDLLRFGLTPLYQRFVDVYDAVDALVEVLESKEYLAARFQRRLKVT